MNFIQLPELPLFQDQRSLFDPVRKKYVVATPEEKVRQAIIQYLIHEKKFPKSLLGVEVSLLVNRLKKRCDIVIYKGNHPLMLVECKAPSVKMEQSVFDQIARYNLALAVPYLLITNGMQAYCCKINFSDSSFQFLGYVPDYAEL